MVRIPDVVRVRVKAEDLAALRQAFELHARRRILIAVVVGFVAGLVMVGGLLAALWVLA